MTQLKDIFSAELNPLTRLKPFFSLRDGIFSPWQRYTQLNQDLASLKIKFEDKNRVELTADFINDQQSLNYKGSMAVVENTFKERRATASTLLDSISSNIITDFSLIKKSSVANINFSILGRQEDLQLGENVYLSSMVEVDTRNGPVFLDDNVQVSAFSLLRGPLYVGKNSHIDKAFIENCIIGQTCKIGGEVADSIIGDFSNKHHEGFLGHSIVGSWVNLGALTTTSDLKNNYGEVKLNYAGEIIATSSIKFGSIIGDYVKTAIGTMLNTGTIIDIASLIFSGVDQQKYYPPFFWGGKHSSRYTIERFLEDSKKIMARRKQQLSANRIKVLRNVFNDAN